MTERIAEHDAQPLVSVRGAVRRYPGVTALRGVDLTIAPGEILALTGENGSGKSTLAKLIGGVEQPDEGTISIDGVETVIANPAAARDLGIVMISQELTLAPSLTVAENIMMGRLPRRGRVVDWHETRRIARGVLRQLDVHVSADAVVRDLSVELQQEVEIARAISARARLLILDEATSSLSEAATSRLLELVRAQAERGVAVLMISHRMPELYSTSHRAVVLRDGTLVGSVPLPEAPEPELVRMMVGRDLGDYYGTRDAVIGEEVLTVEALASVDGELKPTSFTLRSGEVLGVAGLVGSGKAQFAMALGGAIPATGEVRVRGRRVRLGAPKHAIDAGIGYVPDDRRRAALFPVRSVADNFSIAWLGHLGRAGFISTKTERQRIGEAIGHYQVKTSSPTKRITQLSGGNQQKVILGRTFARGCDIYVLSEPTRGVDVGSKSVIYAMIHALATAGAAVIVVSSELPELIGISDRILVFFRGEVCGELAGEEIVEQTIGDLAVSGRIHSHAGHVAHSGKD